MIEGLKVTISGPELKQICLDRAEYHSQREAVYIQQLASMEAAEIEGMHYSNGDPKRNLSEKASDHREQGQELVFIANHIDISELYQLSRDDLRRLGVVRSY